MPPCWRCSRWTGRCCARAVALLWPDVDAERGHNNLRQRLFRQRRTAGRDLVVQGRLLSLASDVDHDLADPQAALQADAEALAGELLGAYDYDGELAAWVGAARQQWGAARGDALATIAARHERADRVAAALPYALRLVRDEPLAEHAARRLMRLHYRRGDRSAALAAYEQLRTRLDTQLGETPAPETVQLASLLEACLELPTAAPPPPVAVLRPPRLVGRDGEWRELRRSWDGRRMLLLVGEAGIGKSRLLHDFAAAQGADCIVVQARPGDMPYATLARLLRALCSAPVADALAPWARAELARLVPELGEAAAGPVRPLRLHDAVACALAQAAPAGVGVDDLHAIDAATWRLLPALCDPRHGPRWWFAARSGEWPEAVREGVAGLDAAALQRIELGPLDPTGVAALLASLALPGLDAAAWAPRLWRHSGGNPMFILETLLAVLRDGRRLDDAGTATLPLPPNVGELLTRRLGRLGATALKLARVAAVAAQDFGVDLAAHVMQATPLDLADAWQELEQAQVLRDHAFAHDLVAEAVLHTLPSPIGRWLHAQVAGWGAAHGAAPGRIAAHWRAAGEPARAAPVYRDAAAQALRLSEHRAAAAWASSAAECYAAVDRHAEAFAARLQHFRAALETEPHAELRTLAEQLLERARTPGEQAAARHARAQVHMRVFDIAALLDDTEVAAARAREAGDEALGMDVAGVRAWGLSLRGEHAQALALLDAWDAAAERIGGSEGARLRLFRATVHQHQDEPARSRPCVESALRMAEQAEDLSLCSWALRVQASCLLSEGRLADSTASFERAFALRPRLGDEQPQWNRDLALFARQQRELGRYDQALAMLDGVAAAQRRADALGLLPLTEAELAITHLWLGQPARAMAVLHPPGERVDPSVLAAHLRARALLAEAQRQPALPLLRQALEVVAPERRPVYRVILLRDMSRLLPPDEALDAAEEAFATSQRLPLRYTLASTQQALCAALLRAGRDAEAARHARAMLDTFDAGQPPALFVPAYLWVAHRALAAVGDAATAADALRRGVAWLETHALPHVPAAFRDSFLQRNPVNRDLFAAARRLAAR